MSKSIPSDLTFDMAEERYKDYLVRNKMFYTKERVTILEVVMERKDHFSVDELLYDMQSKKLRVSRATLYRALSQLVDANILVEADFGHGHIHYELVGGEPHEHLVCVECGMVKEVVSPDLTKVIHSLAKSNGFTVRNQKTQIQVECLKNDDGSCRKSGR